MFEVWEASDDPEIWLVFRESPSFPGSLAVDEWTELGSCAVHEVIATAVDSNGYLVIRAIHPFDANGTLGPEFEPM